MNCIGPWAPAVLSPRMRPMRVSTRWMAARYSHGTPLTASGLLVVGQQRRPPARAATMRQWGSGRSGSTGRQGGEVPAGGQVGLGRRPAARSGSRARASASQLGMEDELRYGGLLGLARPVHVGVGRGRVVDGGLGRHQVGGHPGRRRQRRRVVGARRRSSAATASWWCDAARRPARSTGRRRREQPARARPASDAATGGAAARQPATASPPASAGALAWAGGRQVPDPDVRLPDERPRLRAPGRPARGRRAWRPPTTSSRPTSSSSTPAASGRTPTTSCTATSATSSRSRTATRTCRSRSAAAWPRRTGTSSRQRAPQVDVVFGTHNVGRAVELLRQAADGGRPVMEILDEAQLDDETIPVRPARCGGSCPTPPGSPSRSAATTRCAFCIVPSVRGKEISRPFDEVVDEVRGAGRGRHGRGHPARPERQLLRPRPHPPPAAVRRPPAGGGRRRRHPPGALHQPPSQGPAARDHRGHGRDADGLRAPAPARCSPAATGCWPPCTGATPAARYLEKLAAARAAVPDLAVTTDLIVGLPGRDRRRLRAHPRGGGRGRVRQRLHLRVLAPARHRGGGAWPTGSCRPTWPPSGSSACGSWSSARPWPAPGPRRPGRGGPGRGPEQEGPGGRHRPHPPEQARALPGRRRRAGRRHLRRRPRSPAPPPTTCAASWSRSPPAPATAPASRWRSSIALTSTAIRLDQLGSGTWRWSGRRRRASRRWPWRWPAGWATSSWCRSTPCRCTGGWTSARPSRRRPSGPRCPTTCSTWPTRRRTSRSPASRPTAEAAIAGIEARGHRALLVGGTGLYLQAVVDGLRLPGRVARGAGRAGGGAAEPAGVGALHRRLADARPGGRGPHRAGQRPPHRPGPRGHPRQRPAVLVVRPRPRRLPADDPVPPGRRVAAPAGASTERIEARYRGPARRRVPRRGARACRRRGLSRTARQALGYRELLAHLAGDVHARRGGRRGRPPHPAVRPPPAGVVPPRPPHHLAGRRPRNPVDLLPALLGDWAPPMTPREVPRPGQRLPRPPRPRRPPPGRRGDGARPVRPPPGRGRRRAHPGHGRADADPTHGAVQRRRQPGRDERQRHPLPGPGRGRRRPGAGPEIVVATDAGPRRVTVDDDGWVSVDMGVAKVEPEDAGSRAFVDMGNPHTVVEVEDLDHARRRPGRRAESAGPSTWSSSSPARARRADHAGVGAGRGRDPGLRHRRLRGRGRRPRRGAGRRHGSPSTSRAATPPSDLERRHRSSSPARPTASPRSVRSRPMAALMRSSSGTAGRRSCSSAWPSRR